MTEAEILAGINDVARAHIGVEAELRPETRLVEDLELDSLRAITLAVEVENRFRIALREEDEAGIATVGDLVAVVGRKLAEKRGEGRGEREEDRRGERGKGAGGRGR